MSSNPTFRSFIRIYRCKQGTSSLTAGWVNETARNAFPALERVGEGFAVAEGEEHVDVIGHDDVAPEVVALAVEVMEAVGDDLGEAAGFGDEEVDRSV